MFERACFMSAVAACALSSMTAVAATCGDPQTLVDLRTDAPKAAAVLSPEERQRIARDVFGATPPAFTVNSVVHGAFTRPHADETLYLLQPGGPDASDPQGQQATLAIYAEGHLLRTFPTTLGNRIEATVDVTGSGSAALLLRADSYQMGTSVTRLVLVDAAGEQLQERAVFERASVDACADARFGGSVEASVIRWCTATNGTWPTFDVTRYRAACVDEKAPAVSAFKAMVVPVAAPAEG